jgi:hypothetical protein
MLEVSLVAKLDWFVAISNTGSWGHSRNEAEAIENMRSYETFETTEFNVWACPEEAYVTDDGSGATVITWPFSSPRPVKIKHGKTD